MKNTVSGIEMFTSDFKDNPGVTGEAVINDISYQPVGNEISAFSSAFRKKLAIMLKGPTGCGKTRFVEYMAAKLNVPLYTVSCHEDITASDLVGKHILVDGRTEWIDGPLTRAAKEGGICYLDEVVEARQDATVAIHSLTDHRRELYIERLGGVKITAAENFSLVISYNPGYQSILKDLKMSTRQRMISIELNYPEPEKEILVVAQEGGVSLDTADRLVRLATVLRAANESGLREVPSTRLLIAAALMISDGFPERESAMAAIVGPLTDDEALLASLKASIDFYL